MTFTAQQIVRQRARIVEAALQRVRCLKLQMVIDDDGMLCHLPEQSAHSRAASLIDEIDREAELLITMLSAAAPPVESPPDPREHAVVEEQS